MDVAEHVHPARERASSPLAATARAGYAARGIVYLIVGSLAVAAGLGSGGETAGSRGALQSLNDEPFGQVLILVLAAGLFAYSLWRAVQALLDADDHGTDARGLAVRGGLLVSSITHVVLGYYALSLIFGWPGSGSGDSRDLAHWLMSQPYGRYGVGVVGLSIIGAGLAQVWKGATGGYRKRLTVPEEHQGLAYPVCAFGLVARGLVFTIMGGLFVYAGIRIAPSHAGGTQEALNWLREQPFGEFLFFAAAVGLFLFGLYSIIEAVWRRVNAVEELS